MTITLTLAVLLLISAIVFVVLHNVKLSRQNKELKRSNSLLQSQIEDCTSKLHKYVMKQNNIVGMKLNFNRYEDVRDNDEAREAVDTMVRFRCAQDIAKYVLEHIRIDKKETVSPFSELKRYQYSASFRIYVEKQN